MDRGHCPNMGKTASIIHLPNTQCMFWNGLLATYHISCGILFSRCHIFQDELKTYGLVQRCRYTVLTCLKRMALFLFHNFTAAPPRLRTCFKIEGRGCSFNHYVILILVNWVTAVARGCTSAVDHIAVEMKGTTNVLI
jgi:hypothetical protein